MKQIMGLSWLIWLAMIFTACGGSRGGVVVREEPPTITAVAPIAQAVVMVTTTVQSEVNVAPEVLLIGFDASFPPFESLTNQQKNEGFNLDVLQAIMAKMGQKFEFRGLPWAQAMTDLKTGQIQLLSGAGITDERKKFMLYTDSFVSSDYVVFIPQDSPIIGETKDEVIKNLAGKKVGVLAGGSVLEILRPYKTIQLVTGQNDLELFNLMAKQGLDAVFTDKLVGLYHVKNANFPYKIVGEPLKTQPMATAIDKEGRGGLGVEFLAKYNAALKEIQADGTFGNIYKRWFGKQ